MNLTGKDIRNIRKTFNLTQKETANLMATTIQTVNRYENGVFREVDPEKGERLLRQLNLNFREIDNIKQFFYFYGKVMT